MGIPIEKSFVLHAPRPAVWEFLIDPARVARCLPGAVITETIDERTFAGTITIKVGPVTASYRGTLKFDRLDPAAGEAELSGSGQETRGKGGADMRMKSRVVARSPGETEVTVTSDVKVVGALAQFGRGMIQDVSDQLFQKFTDAMRRELEPDTAVSAPVPATGETAAPAGGAAPPTSPAPVQAAPEPALDVLALGAGAAKRAAGRTLRRPGFWIVVFLVAILIYWWLR